MLACTDRMTKTGNYVLELKPVTDRPEGLGVALRTLHSKGCPNIYQQDSHCSSLTQRENMQADKIWNLLLQNAVGYLQINNNTTGSRAIPFKWHSFMGLDQDCWTSPSSTQGQRSMVHFKQQTHSFAFVFSSTNLQLGVCMCACKCILNKNQTLQCEHFYHDLQMRMLTQIWIAPFNVLLQACKYLGNELSRKVTTE